MSAIRFETLGPVVQSAPNRADVACFVGFVRRRDPTAVPAEIGRWLEVNGWARDVAARRAVDRDSAPLEALLDVPVPIDSWEVFDLLFAWESRVAGAEKTEGGTYLG